MSLRRKKMGLNAVSSLLLQAVTMIFGLIVPRLVIGTFGSEVNGLVSSITQFLSYITLFEAGIGGVTRALLYRPLARGDRAQVNGLVRSTEFFFKRLGWQYLLYAFLLSVAYPLVINHSFDVLFTGSMVLILAASTFVQYYFGIPYSILLQADQRNYISILLQTVSVTLNGLLTILLIGLGFGIHAVKIGSAVIYVFRPLVLRYYVIKKYKIPKDVQGIPLPSEQKRAGVFHNLAWFLRTNSSIAILTILTDLTSVSIYSVYYLIASSLSKIVTSITSGTEAMFGNVMATEEVDYTRIMFGRFVFLMNMVSVIIFSTAACVIIPFIKLYTQRIRDANYMLPLFGLLLLASEFIYCVRKPYHDIITAAGHFHETKNSAIIEVILNVVLAILLVVKFGISGIAVASVIALLYRAVYFIIYLNSHIIYFPMSKSIKYMLIALFQSFLSIVLFDTLCKMNADSYLVLIFYAAGAFLLSSFITVALSLAFFPDEMKFIWHLVVKGRENNTK